MNIPPDAIPRHAENGVGVEFDGGLPGFDSVSMVGVLAGFDPSRLDDDGLLEAMVEAQQVVAAAQARQVKAMAELSRRRPRAFGDPFGEFVADEVAVELCLTRRAAENRVAQAVEMTRRTPAVLHALEAGRLDLYRASAITDATYGLDDATATQVATQVVGRVEGRNASDIRRIVRHTVLRVNPEVAERRRERARADRKVVLTPLDDGMAELTAFLPADQATAVYRRVDALARGARVPGDERGADARRADVFVNLLLGRRDPGVAGEPDGVRPLVHVTVSVSTLAGADDKPGTLDGYGPVGAAFARQIAADPTGTWKRLVTDPVDGSLIEHSRNTYRPPAALNDFIRARDGKCRFPGCQRSAQHCDLDHTIPWPKGPTTVSNLGALCRKHHRLKHETTWQLTQTNGRFCWTSPTGRRYTTEPENYDPGGPRRPAHQVRSDPP